jgi:uncharacterized protein with NRDE domain
MCTLIVDFQQHSRVPLLIAANRDELRSRPASPARHWPQESFVAPRDEQAGGTWLGLTASGLFVGVTNRFLAARDERRQSRGGLVVEALRAPSAQALRAQLNVLDPHRFNAFHLLYADATHAFITWNDGERVTHEALVPGLHVVTERSFGNDDSARVALIQTSWKTFGPQPRVEDLQALLARSTPGDPGGSVCVDVPEWNYGTRSSLVLVRHEVLAHSRWFEATGRPDQTAFIERPELIASLASAS